MDRRGVDMKILLSWLGQKALINQCQIWIRPTSSRSALQILTNGRNNFVNPRAFFRCGQCGPPRINQKLRNHESARSSTQRPCYCSRDFTSVFISAHGEEKRRGEEDLPGSTKIPGKASFDPLLPWCVCVVVRFIVASSDWWRWTLRLRKMSDSSCLMKMSDVTMIRGFEMKWRTKGEGHQIRERWDQGSLLLYFTLLMFPFSFSSSSFFCLHGYVVNSVESFANFCRVFRFSVG